MDDQRRLAEAVPASGQIGLRLFLAAAAAIAGTFASWLDLAQVWFGSNDYAHGPWVALILAGFGVRTAMGMRAERFAPAPSALGLAALVAAVAIWAVAHRASISLGEQLMLPLILGASIAALAGWRACSRFGGALLCLYTIIPVWELALPTLQQMTVVASTLPLRVAGIPVYVEGSTVWMVNGTFEIVDGCSGKRFLIVAVALAGILNLAEGLSRRRSFALVALAAGSAIVGNWLRVTVIMLVGYLTDMDHYLVRVEHFSFGWVMFALFLVPPVLLARRFLATEAPASHPVGLHADALRQSGRGLPIVFFGIATCLAPVALLLSAHATPAAGTACRWSPPALPSSSRVARIDTTWQPEYSGAVGTTRAALKTADGVLLEYFSATYARQARGSELVSYDNRLSGRMKQDKKRALYAGNTRIALLEVSSATGEVWHVAYINRVGDFWTSSDLVAQLYYGFTSWFGTPRSSVIALGGPCVGAGECGRLDMAIAAAFAGIVERTATTSLDCADSKVIAPAVVRSVP